MTQTHYIRDQHGDLVKPPVKPLTALLSDEVCSLAANVNNGENTREELVRYVQDLVHEASVAETVTEVALRLSATLNDDASMFSDVELLTVAKTVVDVSDTIEWDDTDAQKGRTFCVSYIASSGDSLTDLVRAVGIWLTDDDYPTQSPRHYLNVETRLLYQCISRMMERNFIGPNGRLDQSAVNRVVDELDELGHCVKHVVVESDSFGPLICGLKTSKGVITYG